MIHRATVSDAMTVAQLAAKMWNSHTREELTADFAELLKDDNAAVFLCLLDGKAIGFAQCQLRHDYVECTRSSPVGYLEGVYVEAEHRNRGYATRLVGACEQWAREQGCTEFASDCEINNQQSLAFHLHSGFQEANRIICFVKKIG